MAGLVGFTLRWRRRGARAPLMKKLPVDRIKPRHAMGGATDLPSGYTRRCGPWDDVSGRTAVESVGQAGIAPLSFSAGRNF